MTNSKTAGFLQIIYYDEVYDRVLTLGGAGFLTEEQLDTAWQSVQEAPAEQFTNFQVCYLDKFFVDTGAHDPKDIEACEVENLLGQPVRDLISVAAAQFEEQQSVSKNNSALFVKLCTK